jgi:alkaline phosphatase
VVLFFNLQTIIMKRIFCCLIAAILSANIMLWGQNTTNDAAQPKLAIKGVVFNKSYAVNDSIKLQVYKNDQPYTTVKVQPVKGNKVKNVIFLIGDGMGLSHLYTAWTANHGHLNIENCTYIGLSKTYCANKLITDSGASGTAMSCGQKTNYHSIGVDVNGTPLPSLTDIAHAKGLSTGIVITSYLTDATPSVFCAKNIDREASEAIALDYLNCNVDFIFGGGVEKFVKRTDHRNLLKELAGQGYQICDSWNDVAKIKSGRVFCSPCEGCLPSASERGDLFTKSTMKAIELMNQNKKGFFAMFEGSCIDDYAHGNNLAKTIEEIFDFDQAIGAILQWAEKDKNTLVIITADHETGGLSLLGGDLEKGEVVNNFISHGHSGVMVPVYAYGPGAENFTGFMENTELFDKIKSLLHL